MCEIPDLACGMGTNDNVKRGVETEFKAALDVLARPELQSLTIHEKLSREISNNIASLCRSEQQQQLM